MRCISTRLHSSAIASSALLLGPKSASLSFLLDQFLHENSSELVWTFFMRTPGRSRGMLTSMSIYDGSNLELNFDILMTI